MMCALCKKGCGWVCESHPTKPSYGDHACPCGGAGMPCPRCNKPAEGKRHGCQKGSGRRSIRRAGAIEKKGLSARFMRRGQSRCVNELLTSSDRQRSYAGPLLSETRR